MQPHTVSLTPAAEADLVSIRDHIGQKNPAAARRMALRLLAAFDSLERLPRRGRPGAVPGTRELVAVPPYVIVYRLVGDGVQVLRVWHSAQHR